MITPHSQRLVIVDDFHVLRPAGRPAEADPVLLIDPDAVLSLSIALERFEPVSRRRAKVLEHFSDVELIEFPLRDRPKISRTTAPSRLGINVIVNLFGSSVRE